MKFTLKAVSHLTGIPMMNEKWCNLRKPGQAGDQVTVEKHFPVAHSPTEETLKPRKRCKNCAKDGKHTDTFYFCNAYKKKSVLCVKCFAP